RALLVDVHEQRRHIAVDLELPVAIARRIGGEVDARLAVAHLAFGISHRGTHSVETRSPRKSPSWCSCRSRLANSETVSSRSPGASRCGACRTPGNSATSTGQ